MVTVKHLEKQMNDNQETKTALEMSERDIESYAVVSEWANGDECVYVNDKETIYTYVGMHPHGDGHYIFNDEKGITYVANGYIHEPLTPEQKKANEIIAWEGFFHEISLTEIAGILVDNNILAPEKYRKQ